MMRKIVTFVLLLICLSVTSVAQMGGGMTDKQVVEYVQNGLLQGKSQQQISTELARRGVTKEQAERVKLLYEQQKKNGKNSSSSTLDNTKGRSRTKNGVKEKEDGKDGSDYIDKNFNFDDSSEKKEVPVYKYVTTEPLEPKEMGTYTIDRDGNIVYEVKKNKETGSERKYPVVEGYGRKIIDIIKEKFAFITDDLGYNISCEVLNTVDYGVPENRERVFVVGIRKDLDMEWKYPTAIKADKLSVKDAISDLPVVLENQNITNYTSQPQNEYQRLMRGHNNVLTEHYCGVYGDKIRTVIQNVKQGEGKEDFNKLVENGVVDKKYRLTSGYKNTYGRLIEDIPAPTITNNMTAPSGLRCIHYSQNRALTPREGARIQSFPDWFEFRGGVGSVTTQIGNAVPPLMALKLAKQIEKLLKG